MLKGNNFTSTVQREKKVQWNVETVCGPEGFEKVTTTVLNGKHVHNDDYYSEDYSCQA